MIGVVSVIILLGSESLVIFNKLLISTESFDIVEEAMPERYLIINRTVRKPNPTYLLVSSENVKSIYFTMLTSCVEISIMYLVIV